MKGFDSKWYEDHKAYRERNRKCSIVQKHEDDNNKTKTKADNKPKETGMDGSSNQPARISITWLVSDKRRRDGWGMAETIADCIVAAFGRFSGQDATGKSKRKIRK